MFQAVSRPTGAFQAACHATCNSVVILTAAYSVLLSRFITFRCEPSLHSIQPVSSPPAAHNFARLRVAAGCGLSCFLYPVRMDRFSKVALKSNKKTRQPLCKSFLKPRLIPVSAKATPSNRLRFRQSTYVAQPPSFLRLSLFSTLAPLAGRLAKACLAVRNPFVPHSLQPPASRLAAGAFSCVSPPHNPARR